MPKYKTNFLTNVIARIDFTDNISNVETGLNHAFTKDLLKIFPIFEQGKAIEGKMEIRPEGVSSEVVKEYPVYNFYDENKDNHIQIGSNFLFVETKSYEDFKPFLDQFEKTIDLFYSNYSGINIKRFGLRFINNITLNEKKMGLELWSQYISEELLGLLKLPTAEESVTRAFSILSVKKKENDFIFQFGIHNPDYPAPVKKQTFILDFDAYCVGLEGKDALKQKISQLHEQIEASFEKYTTQRFKDYLDE